MTVDPTGAIDNALVIAEVVCPYCPSIKGQPCMQMSRGETTGIPLANVHPQRKGVLRRRLAKARELREAQIKRARALLEPPYVRAQREIRAAEACYDQQERRALTRWLVLYSDVITGEPR